MALLGSCGSDAQIIPAAKKVRDAPAVCNVLPSLTRLLHHALAAPGNYTDHIQEALSVGMGVKAEGG